MKLMNTFSVGVAIMGMTGLVGHASAASTAADDLISDSMLVAQSTPSPGGKGGGTAGETGRADKGLPTKKGSKNPGTGADETIPEKATPGTEKDTATGGNTGSDSGRTGTSSGSSGSSTGNTGGSGSSGMSGGGSGSSSGAGAGGK